MCCPWTDRCGTYGDAVPKREDAKTLPVEGRLASLEFGRRWCSQHGRGCCAEREECLGEMHVEIDRVSVLGSLWLLV